MNRLAELRKEKSISQAELGKILGVAQNTLCNWEKGNREIDNLSLIRISDFFNVSVDYVLGKSKYKNINEVIEYNWGLMNDPYFEPPFDFASLLSPLRKEQGISLSEFGNVIGATKEQMEEIEEGILPITYEQAEKLCKYLDTNVSQVLFDNELYGEEVPEKYHDKVKEWENIRKTADEEAIKEADQTLNPDIRMIARAGKKMTPEQAENLRKYAQYMFPEAFSDD